MLDALSLIGSREPLDRGIVLAVACGDVVRVNGTATTERANRMSTTQHTLEVLGEYVGRFPNPRLRYPMVRISTGRVVLIGKHSYSSMVREDGSEMPREEYVDPTRDEQDEIWNLVGRHSELVGRLDELGVTIGGQS